MNYELTSPLEAIQARHSVRHYLHKPLPQEVVDVLRTRIAVCNQQGRLHIQLVTNERKAFTGMFAYGRFSGVENYLVLAGQPSFDLHERIGYYGEQLVLLAQQLGLNTCWAGLSYRKVDDAYAISADERLIGMIALGYGKTQGKAHKVKSAEQVSNAGPDTPQWFHEGVKAALLAPSSYNQQRFSFTYLPPETDGIASVKAERGFSLLGYTQMDLGIAKLHFETGAGKDNFKWI